MSAVQIKDKADNELLTRARVKDDEYRTMQVQASINRKEKYKQELQDQMIYKEKNRRFEYDQFLGEKKMLDDIAERIYYEDERAREEKYCNMKRLQEEIKSFKDAQLHWKEKHKQEVAEEHRKIQEYMLSKASDAKAKKEEKERQEAAKAKIFDEIAMKMYEVKRDREEREEILLQLLEEESKEEVEKRHRAEVDKEIRMRHEVLTSLTKQMEEHKVKMSRQAEEDALYKEQLIAKIAEDERVEQLSNEKKRLKLVSVRKAVEEMMVKRRQEKAEQMQLQMKLLELEQQQAEEKSRIIQEERIKMLREHGDNVVGYLPKGTINPEDVLYLGNDVVDQWCQKKKT